MQFSLFIPSALLIPGFALHIYETRFGLDCTQTSGMRHDEILHQADFFSLFDVESISDLFKIDFCAVRRDIENGSVSRPV